MMRQCDKVVARGDAVRLGITGATSKSPQSSARTSSPLDKDAVSQERSHLAISEPGGPTLTEPASRIPTLKSPSSGWAKAAESRSQKTRPTNLKPRKKLTHSKRGEPRHDSTQFSLADIENGTGLELLQPRTCEPAAKQLGTTQASNIHHSDSRPILEIPEGAQLRTEAKKGQDDVQGRSTVVTNLVRSRSFLTTEVKPADRYVRSLLDPRFPPTPALSASPSVEIISDGGEGRHLHQETYSWSEVESQCVDSQDEDEDPSLMASVASIQPQSTNDGLVYTLMKARIVSHDSEGQKARFIPKRELRRVINKHTVKLELKEHFPKNYPAEKIDFYTKKVCQDTRAKESHDGGKKIRSYRKVFALLVLVESWTSIVHCVKNDIGLSDQDLPLTMERDEDNLPELYRRRDSAKRPIELFRKWSPVKLEKFYDYQWWLLAPFFSPDSRGTVKHYVLQDEHIMPFISPSSINDQTFVKVGGYGEVRGVQIHSDHHEFEDKLSCARGFAVKKQRHEDYRNIFKREAEILRKFSGNRSHDHVVSLLASYEQFRKIHLIFYRAQGTLEEYWNQIVPFPEFTHANVKWFASQCWGIADGLLRLHKILAEPTRKVSMDDTQDKVTPGSSNHSIKKVSFKCPPDRVGTDASITSNGVLERSTSPIVAQCGELRPLDGYIASTSEFDASRKRYGRHGDINPSNLLWYQGRDEQDKSLTGTLKLADFGQAEINSEDTKTKKRDVANTLTYRPPECDTQPSIIRQSYDIWSLGCVYLEFISWMLGGNRMTQKFARKRNSPDVFLANTHSDTFFEVVREANSGEERFRIKPAVTQSIIEMHGHANCSMFLHDFLILIRDRMLIVDSKKRDSCENIGDELKIMLKTCQQDEAYAIQSNPWCDRPPLVSHPVRLSMTPDAERKIQENLPRQAGTLPQAQSMPATQVTKPKRPSRIPRPRLTPGSRSPTKHP